MKHLSSVVLLTVLLKFGASKISNAVPSIPRGHHGNLKLHQARPVRDLQYKTIEELQQESAAQYSPDYYGQPATDLYRDASPRTCGHKKEYATVQPVYISAPQVHHEVSYSAPVQHYQQIAVPHTSYEEITVPHTEYQQITVPHTEYHQVTVPHTEYQHVTVPHTEYNTAQVPVQTYQSYQSYPVYTSYSKKPCFKSADEDTAINPAVSEFSDTALRDTALYQAIGKSLGSGYDMSAPAPAMIAPEIPEYGRQAQYQYEGRSAYAQYQNAPLTEMRAAAPDMRATYAPEMKAAYAPEMKAAYTPEMKAAYVPEMKAAAAPEFNHNAYLGEARSAQYQAEGKSAQAYADMNQRAAIAPEMRSAIAPEMRSAIAPEMRSAIAPEMRSAIAPEMRSAIAPEMSRAAYADQRAAIAPEMRAAYAPEMSRAAQYEMNQRSAIAPEWSRNAPMFQPDGRSVYANMYQRAAVAAPEFGRSAGMYYSPYGRNAEYQPIEKSASMEKATIPEGKPAPAAPQPSNTQSNPANLVGQKGKSETQSAHH